MSDNHREHERIVHAAEINLSFPEHNKDMVAVTRDISDGGLFINCPDHPKELKKGDAAEIEAIGIPDPIKRPAKVVRIQTKEGVAIQFNKE